MLTPTDPRWHMGSTTHQRLGSHLPVHWWSVLCKERTANSSSPLGFSWSMPFSSERQRHTSGFHSYRVLKGQIRVPASTQTHPHTHILQEIVLYFQVCARCWSPPDRWASTILWVVLMSTLGCRHHPVRTISHTWSYNVWKQDAWMETRLKNKLTGC